MSHQISLLESQKHHSNNSLREAHDRLVAIQKQFEARLSRAEDVECMNSLRDRLATADTYIKTLNDDNLNRSCNSWGSRPPPSSQGWGGASDKNHQSIPKALI
eukprot:GHVR01005779.1.p1 GENE.GHVR01005779.1~~GHVR01005779.1.p1  ORF type:complete len:103 (-),score=21.03 GHVR01005779.1:32-340(-)